MDIFNLATSIFLFLLLLFIILTKFLTPSTRHRLPLPPGPKPWPILGNLLHLDKKLHISLTNYANLYGPLISLKLGARFVVVASTPEAISQIIKTHDRITSGRFIQAANPHEGHVLDRIAIIWATECNNWWKSVRTLCRTELFSAKAIESQAYLRETKVQEMVDFLRSREGKVVSIGDVVFTCVFNMLSNIFLSKDLLEFDTDAGSGLKDLVWKMIDVGACANIADFYPVLAKLDPQGLKRKLTRYCNEMFKVWETDIKERREMYEGGRRRSCGSHPDFLDIFVQSRFDDQQINWLIFVSQFYLIGVDPGRFGFRMYELYICKNIYLQELFVAGTETTTTTIEWTITELLRNPEAMRKVQEELSRELREKNAIKESQVSELPFLTACIKEVFRLHPPVPFLVPHRTLETCEIMNYRIPKDAQIFLNVYAVGRDPSIWEDPLLFNPERFIETDMDFKGHDFELIPFGSGRRICPGLPMGMKQVSLILSSLIHFFDWSLPDGNDPLHLDTNEKFGITVRREQPLNIIPKQRV